MFNRMFAAVIAVSLFVPGAALAFNPQPDPPGKVMKQALGGPDTKTLKGSAREKSRQRVGYHEVDIPALKGSAREKPGQSVGFHEVDRPYILGPNTMGGGVGRVPTTSSPGIGRLAR